MILSVLVAVYIAHLFINHSNQQAAILAELKKKNNHK